MDNTTLVFVYGSLLSGLGNHGILARGNAELVATTRTIERFTMYSLGPFPACVPDMMGTTVAGEVYRVDAETLERLDALEGYRPDDDRPNLYDRISVHLDGGILALMYVMRSTPRWGVGPVVADGDWRPHHAAQRWVTEEELPALEDDDELDHEACPGCGCMPGDGLTDGCVHPDGCGFY